MHSGLLGPLKVKNKRKCCEYVPRLLTHLLKGLGSVYLCILSICVFKFYNQGQQWLESNPKLRTANQSLDQLRKYAANFVDSVYFCFRWLDSPFKGRKFNFNFKLGWALLTKSVMEFNYITCLCSSTVYYRWLDSNPQTRITNLLFNWLQQICPGLS
jgi:hypothetical protein